MKSSMVVERDELPASILFVIDQNNDKARFPHSEMESGLFSSF
ncbi:hypothetical protein [Thalassobacillus cyri]|nr:hypothetical protein [Thalassobacillus cyri]